jgi:type IV pilus assembly protein PilC
MPVYTYEAKAMNGSVIIGKLEAQDEGGVLSHIKEKGSFPLAIKRVDSVDDEIKALGRKKVSMKDLAIFARQFYVMLNAGVPIVTCLELLRKQTESPTLANAITKLYEAVQRGTSLSEAMKQYSKIFPVIAYSMCEIGEMSGNLDVALERLAVYLDKEKKMSEKIGTAMAYPMVIGGIAFAMVVFMVTVVAPKFISMFKSSGKALPVPTQVLLSISGLFTNIWFIIGVVVSVVLFKYILTKLKEFEKFNLMKDAFLLSLPLIGGNLQKIIAARFSRALCIMLQSGVPIIKSLEVINRLIDNAVFKKAMYKVMDEVKKGTSLAVALDSIGIFPAMVIQMISIGEESGAIDSMVEKVADYYEEELDTTLTRLVSLLEPVLILCIAVVVGGIVLAMIMPIFSMYKSVGKK